MANYIEYDCFAYIESRSGLQERIIAIDNIILANEDLMLKQVLTQSGGTAMYELDDGQIRIKVNYRSMEDLIKTMNGLEAIKQRYIRRLNGSAVVLRDKRTIRGGWWGGGCNC